MAMLTNSRLHRASIHYEGAISYRIEKYRLLGLIYALKSGSETAAREIVLGHLALTLSMAARYAFINKRKKYDIVGVAVLALCDCVDRIRTKQTILKDSHIDRYIQTYVTGKITNFLKVDHVNNLITRSLSPCRNFVIDDVLIPLIIAMSASVYPSTFFNIINRSRCVNCRLFITSFTYFLA